MNEGGTVTFAGGVPTVVESWVVFGDPKLVVITKTTKTIWWRRLLCRVFLGSTFTDLPPK